MLVMVSQCEGKVAALLVILFTANARNYNTYSYIQVATSYIELMKVNKHRGGSATMAYMYIHIGR